MGLKPALGGVPNLTKFLKFLLKRHHGPPVDIIMTVELLEEEFGRVLVGHLNDAKHFSFLIDRFSQGVSHGGHNRRIAATEKAASGRTFMTDECDRVRPALPPTFAVLPLGIPAGAGTGA